MNYNIPVDERNDGMNQVEVIEEEWFGCAVLTANLLPFTDPLPVFSLLVLNAVIQISLSCRRTYI